VWLGRLLLALLLVLLLLAALVACDESSKPASLSEATLVDPRLVTGPVCLEEAVDLSGSMNAYVAQRERAERELFAFGRRVLDDGDLLSVAFFAESAALALPPSPIKNLAAPPGVPVGLGSGTSLAPAIDALVAGRSAAVCATRALVVITDGVLGDDPAILRSALGSGRYARMFAVVPAASGWGRPGPLNGEVLDSIVVYHFHEGGWGGRAASVIGDAKPLDVVFGEIIGSLTGQRLVRAEPSAGASQP
jgi:hypothetical protein